MGLAARYLWFWARRVVPFVADRCSPAQALAATASVRVGTRIDVLGFDAASVAAREQWRRS